MSTAGLLELQIPFAKEGVVSVDLRDALRGFGGRDIGQEVIGAETIASGGRPRQY